MSTTPTLLLDAKQIRQKITRIAHEIHEKNYLEQEIILVGVVGNGIQFSIHLSKVLSQITGMKVTLCTIELNKEKPSSPVHFSNSLDLLEGKSVVLVDDVLNTGRTLMYAAQFVLSGKPKKLSIATLVDRFHRNFPVHADFVGLMLSTHLKEHVRVELDEGKEGVYLE